MDDTLDALAAQFDAHRAHLHAVAYRSLGSSLEADDAVQEAWLRLSRTDTNAVDNLGGWLTTVVARVCLDMLRSRESRREEALDADDGAVARIANDAIAPDHDLDHDLVLADSVGAALRVVLETLAPAERLAFVLHDLFAIPFESIAPIVGRSVVATRQLASRARRRVQGANPSGDRDRARHREVVEAFLAASRDGDFDALLTVLDPDVVLRADAAAVAMGARAEVRGAAGVAATFAGRAQAARLAVIDGAIGAIWIADGRPRVAFEMTLRDGQITTITLLADPEQLGALQWTQLEG